MRNVGYLPRGKRITRRDLPC